MKIYKVIFLFFALILGLASPAHGSVVNSGPYFFVENKGQIIDQNGKINKGVLFQYSDREWNVSICDSGFRYQLDQFDLKRKVFNSRRFHQTFNFEKSLSKCEKEYLKDGSGSILAIRFKEVFAGVNLYIEGVNNNFKYSFEINHKGTYKLIRWKYYGIDSDKTIYPSDHIDLIVNKQEIIDDFPAVFIKDAFGGKIYLNKPRFKNFKNGIGFEFDETIILESGQILIVDPQPSLKYCSFFGGKDVEYGVRNIFDDSSNYYVAGTTSSSSNISTTGSYQTTFSGKIDCFIAKFSKSNNLLWSTYFGGANEDVLTGLIYCPKSNSIFISGHTQSSKNIASTNAWKTSYSGGTDAFIAKLSSAGSVLWSSYYGGSANDRIFDITLKDTSILVVGLTESTTGIATSKAFQSSYGGSGDGFFAEFGKGGGLIHGSYFGGSNYDELNCVKTLDINTLVFAGNTFSSGLGTGFTFRPTYNNNMDGFIACFDSFSSQRWCTYYGGSRDDEILDLSILPNKNIVVCGGTFSISGISSTNGFQTSYRGSGDGFYGVLDISKGTQKYGTYFGGKGYDKIQVLKPDLRGNINIAGITQSDSFISTNGSLQEKYAGNFDGFLSKFGASNRLLWSTYLGKSKDEFFDDLNISTYNDYLITGQTSSDSLATTGSFQNKNNGGDDGLIIFTRDCPTNLSMTISKKNIDCYSEKTGSIILTVSDTSRNFVFGIDPYSLKTTNKIQNLIAGRYKVYAVDSMGCQLIDSVVLTEPSNVIISANVKNNKCFGDAIGEISLNVSGGVSPYNYYWNTTPPSTTSKISSLVAGKYTCTIKDANGCIKYSTSTIVDPTLIILTSSKSNVNCKGNSTGSVTLTAGGGKSPYTYQNGTGSYQTSNVFGGLVAGNYTFTVKDSNGCLQSLSVSVTEPTLLTLSSSVTNLACNGISSGSVTLTGSGGTSPYRYKVGTGSYQSSTTFSGLAAGTYSFTVIDTNSCTIGITEIVTQPTKLTLTSSVKSVDCKGNSTGSVTLTVGGGTSPYRYKLGTGSYQSSATFSGLAAGTYSFTVMDTNSCTIGITEIVTQPTKLTLTSSVKSVDCKGNSTGSVTLTAGGGKSPYTYQNGTGSYQTSNVFGGLVAGNYAFTVKDSNGCTQLSKEIVTEPTKLTIGIALLDSVNCNNGTDGRILTTISGGVSPYTYQWNDSSKQTTMDAINLKKGTYRLIAKDASGCLDSITGTVNQPAKIAIVITIYSVNCYQGADGALTTSTTGGSNGYKYIWNDPSKQTSSKASSLKKGTYKVIVKDSYGCSDSATGTVNEPAKVTLSITKIDSVKCYQGAEGALTTSTTGGSNGYKYIWNDPSKQTSSKASSLKKGTYKVIVKDLYGCSDSATGTVNEPAKVTLSITKIDSVKCYQGADGALTTSTTGGSNGYKYIWNDPSKQTSSKASSLKKGTYKVIVKDLYGCSDSATGTVNEPAKVTLSITKIDSVKCYQGADGALTTSTTGGSNGYKYIWNDPSKQTSSKASSLKKGTYKVIVKDLYGCSDSATGTVNEPAKIVIAITIDSVNCYQGSDGSITTSISGGSNGYKYIWDDASKQTTSKAINLKKGTYKLIVKDIYGCTDSIKAKVNEPAKVTISLVSAEDITCYGKGDGQISVSAAGGTPAIKFSWSHSTALNTSTVKIKNKGLYFVKVVDYYGCTDSMIITINEPDPLLLFVDSVTRPKCFGSADGQITVNSKGGNNGFVYTWLTTPNRYGKSLTAIKSGKYLVKVVDSKGCFDDLSIEITNPDSLNSTLIVDSVLCQGTKTGRLLVIPKGGTPGYSYSWVNNLVNKTSLNENLGIGNYIVYVIDKNNCKQKLQGEIKEPSKLTLAKNRKMVSCFGGSDGEIVVQPIGGTLPYKYSWGSNPILNDDNIKNLEFGIYNVYVKDRNNCILNDTIQILQPKKLDVAVITKKPTCYQYQDGNISLLVSGGTPGFICKWDKYPTINSTTLVNISAGKYVVDILDKNGCALRREIEMGDKDSIKIKSIISAPKCNGSTDASVSILKINSQGPLSVKWTSLGGKINNSLNNLSAGKYPIEITDSVGCKLKTYVKIQNPELLKIFIDQKNESCKSRLDGQIAIKATGGMGRYQFYLDTQMSRYGVFYNLKEGGYKAMVKDSNGCSTFRAVNITAPDSLKIVKLFQRDNLCFGQNLGAIGVQGIGGSVPYDYFWNHGSTTDTINGLVAGNYSLTITDKNGCQSNNLFTIKQPEKLKLAIENIINPYCPQNQSGSFDLRVFGGTPPFQYWKNGKKIKSSEFEKLDTGKFVCQVSDVNNCIVSDSINLKYQRLLSASIPGPLIFEKNRFRMIIPIFSGIDTQFAQYSWTKSSDFKEQTFVKNPIVRFTENKWIKLTVIDDKNCTAEDSAELLVFDGFERSLPNSFTPNGDGVNDVLEFPKYLTIKELIIFDRFGKVLFESFSDDPIWNGDCENRSVPQGNYTYIVSFQLPGLKEIIKVKGLLTILR